jgi:hypothetical protein
VSSSYTPGAPPASPAAGILSGVGSPLGVVSALPGAVYIDTAGTNGAWQWTKQSGAGTSGWVCSVGDTGWINVCSWDAAGSVWQGAALLHPDWKPRTGQAGYFYLRRNGNQVFATATNLAVATAGSAQPIIVGGPPAGFTSPASTSTAVARYTSANAASLLYLTSGLSRGSNIGTAVDDYLVTVLTSWITRDAWPTALPGPVAITA